MLVLTRKLNTTIVIDGCIRVTVVGIRGNQVRLGIEAPGHVSIFREELCTGNCEKDPWDHPQGTVSIPH
ncbi:carbon storage regulator [Singulisphaera rosea]